jgi:hypothetical protein
MTNPHHDQSRLHGRCHCGKIVFSTPAQLDFAAARRCDCSLCRRRWAVMVSCPLDQFILEKGAESLSPLSMEYGDCQTLFLQDLRDLHASYPAK